MKKTLFIMLLASLLMVGLASAATFQAPTSSSTIRGAAQLFNVSTTMNNVSNCTITGSSAASGDSLSSTVLVNWTNTLKNVNDTLSTFQFTDATDWTFTGSCINATGTSESITAITSVTVDNTRPVCTWTTTVANNAKFASDATFTVTGTNGTAATLQLGGNSYTMTESSDTFSFSDAIPEGVYNPMTVSVTDGTNTTSCTSYSYIEIANDQDTRKKAVAGLAGQEVEQQQKEGATTTTLIVLALAVVIILNMNGSKKGGKKKR